jgi:hypothetical protein
MTQELQRPPRFATLASATLDGYNICVYDFY